MIQIRKSLLLLTIGVILLSGCTVPDAPVPALPSITPTPTPASTPIPTPGETPQEVTFDQLLANPVQYNGRLVVLEGFYFSGWEFVVLVGKLHYTGYAPKWVAPEGRMVWIERVPREVVDKLYLQQMPGLPTERYGKVRITGKFEYGGKYGHVGAYSSQIVTLKAELLPWSPPIDPVSLTNKGPVTLWYMDEGNGDILHDRTSNHNDGIINGATWESGKFRQALRFDGQNDWVTVKQPFIFHKPTDATVSFWVKIPAPGRYSIFWTRGDEQDLNRFHIWLEVLYFDAPKGGGQLSSAGFDYVSPVGVRHEFNTVVFPQNQWVHVAITRSKNTYSFYRDGKLQWELTDTNPVVPDYAGDWFIGRGYSRWGRERTPAQLTMFSGLMDEVAMYDRALSAAEIFQLASKS